MQQLLDQVSTEIAIGICNGIESESKSIAFLRNALLGNSEKRLEMGIKFSDKQAGGDQVEIWNSKIAFKEIHFFL